MDVIVDFRTQENSVYTGYVCRDAANRVCIYNSDEMKRAMISGEINPINMQMRSNGSIRYTKQYLDSLGINDGQIAEYEKHLIQTTHNPGNHPNILMSGCLGHSKIASRPFNSKLTLEYKMELRNRLIQLNRNLAFYYYYTANILDSSGYPIGRVFYQIDRSNELELTMVELYNYYINTFPSNNTGIVYAEFINGRTRFIGLRDEANADILSKLCNITLVNGKTPVILGEPSYNILAERGIDMDVTRLYRNNPDRPTIKIDEKLLQYEHISTLNIGYSADYEDTSYNKKVKDNRVKQKQTGLRGLMSIFKR